MQVSLEAPLHSSIGPSAPSWISFGRTAGRGGAYFTVGHARHPTTCSSVLPERYKSCCVSQLTHQAPPPAIQAAGAKGWQSAWCMLPRHLTHLALAPPQRPPRCTKHDVSLVQTGTSPPARWACLTASQPAPSWRSGRPLPLAAMPARTGPCPAAPPGTNPEQTCGTPPPPPHPRQAIHHPHPRCPAPTSPSSIFFWMSRGSSWSTVQPTETAVPRISFTVPAKEAAQLLSRMIRAISKTSSRLRQGRGEGRGQKRAGWFGGQSRRRLPGCGRGGGGLVWLGGRAISMPRQPGCFKHKHGGAWGRWIQASPMRWMPSSTKKPSRQRCGMLPPHVCRRCCCCCHHGCCCCPILSAGPHCLWCQESPATAAAVIHSAANPEVVVHALPAD